MKDEWVTSDRKEYRGTPPLKFPEKLPLTDYARDYDCQNIFSMMRDHPKWSISACIAWVQQCGGYVDEAYIVHQ